MARFSSSGLCGVAPQPLDAQDLSKMEQSCKKGPAVNHVGGGDNSAGPNSFEYYPTYGLQI